MGAPGLIRPGVWQEESSLDFVALAEIHCLSSSGYVSDALFKERSISVFPNLNSKSTTPSHNTGEVGTLV